MKAAGTGTKYSVFKADYTGVRSELARNLTKPAAEALARSEAAAFLPKVFDPRGMFDDTFEVAPTE